MKLSQAAAGCKGSGVFLFSADTVREAMEELAE